MGSSNTLTIVPSSASIVDTLETELKEIIREHADLEKSRLDKLDMLFRCVVTRNEVVAVRKFGFYHADIQNRAVVDELISRDPSRVDGVIRVGIEDTVGSGNVRTYDIDGDGGWNVDQQKSLHSSRVSRRVVTYKGENPVPPAL